jgi:MinD-like ATPase involved in chromosome partitioning or flagellar assembly
MATIVSIHSFRGGTGKSNTTANLAALLVVQGKLNDYLWHGRDIKDVAMDVTPPEAGGQDGKLYLVPSSVQPGEITRVLREGYDARRLTEGFRQLVTDLDLDMLMIDTHPGLNEETLLSLVISNVLIIVMRPDQQDYEGTGITARVAQELNVPRILIVVNKTPPRFDADDVRQKVEQAYGSEVAAILPHDDDMMELASAGIFSMKYPDHWLTELYHQINNRLSVS